MQPLTLQQKIDRILNAPIGRRRFLKATGASAAITLLPLTACTPVQKPARFQFSAAGIKTLAAVQEHLFPHEEDSPGASDINALNYLQNTLNQYGFDPEISAFILEGLDKLIQFTKARGPAFEALDFNQRDQLLQEVQETGWGQNWTALILTYLFEALLADPIYGGNPDEIGWTWLDHTPGLPRPTPKTRYRDPDKG